MGKEPQKGQRQLHSIMRQNKLILILLLWPFLLPSQDALQVRLYSNQAVKRLMITTDSVNYAILALNEQLELIDTIHDIFPKDPSRTFIISTKGNGLGLKRGDEDYGSYAALRFVGLDTLQQFRILANRKERSYFGDILLKPKGGDIHIINEVDLELYVAGVVESEAGHVPQLEFFKAQAVLARTFALRNLKKHASEGYNLKDDVSSQVYLSRAHYTHKDLIEQAVKETRDSIVVGMDCRPILGVFHANSGGFTVNSEDVWYQAIDHLKSVEDSFSIGVGSYNWEKRIDADKFYSYFARMFGVKNDVKLLKALLNLNRDGRQSHFKYEGKTLKLTKVRAAFGLKSTYFTVEPAGAELSLKGHGFGHGVGLSQDGAIEMSRRGYSYKSILKHYYRNIDIDSIKSSRVSRSFESNDN